MRFMLVLDFLSFLEVESINETEEIRIFMGMVSRIFKNPDVQNVICKVDG